VEPEIVEEAIATALDVLEGVMDTPEEEGMDDNQ
jgi:hypothetical protein